MNSSLQWVLPPQKVDTEGSFLDDCFANKENEVPKKITRRRATTTDVKPRRLFNEINSLQNTLKGMEVGSEYTASSERPFTRLQKRRMTVDVAIRVCVDEKRKPASSSKASKARRASKLVMPPPQLPKKLKPVKKETSSRSKKAAEVETAGKIVEQAPEQVLERLELPSSLTFAQVLDLCQQQATQAKKSPIRSPLHFLSQFPDTASFEHCADGISFCRVANGTGIIRIQGNKTRKFSFTNEFSINIFMLTGSLQVTFRRSESPSDAVSEVVNLNLLDYLCLKSNVAYQLANIREEEAICFFWRESSSSSSMKNL